MIPGWWPRKVRQTRRHVFGRVTVRERHELATWLSPAQLALFETMHRADQRHGLDVVAALRAAGHDDRELLLAGLLHDCAKGKRIGLAHRVGWSLADRYGRRVRSAGERLPGFAAAYRILDDHAERSARLAAEAGCSDLVCALIRRQDDPQDDPAVLALRLADEAS